MPTAPLTHRAVARAADAAPSGALARHLADADRRGTSTERGYDSAWRRARDGFIRRHPLCVCCRANGRTEPAAVVDHIVPHRGDKALFWDRDNWQALCEACHNSIKPRMERAWTLGDMDARELRLDRALPALFVPAL